MHVVDCQIQLPHDLPDIVLGHHLAALQLFLDRLIQIAAAKIFGHNKVILLIMQQLVGLHDHRVISLIKSLQLSL